MRGEGLIFGAVRRSHAATKERSVLSKRFSGLSLISFLLSISRDTFCREKEGPILKRSFSRERTA
jgi:hypothetical protein